MATAGQRISPMFWFDTQAEDAVKLYTSVFPDSKTGRIACYGKEASAKHGQKEGDILAIEFELDGQRFNALNAGPHFKINPSISLFATFESEGEVNNAWEKLGKDGKVLMALDKYPWSEKYGWLEDRFGISWQIALGDKKNTGGQSIVTFLMFVKEHAGQAEEAMKYYTSLFKNSKIEGVMRYGPNAAPDKEGTVQHAQFTLEGQTFMIMDSAHAHAFNFNEAVSLVVNCDTQEEIDYYWEKLTAGGDPKAQMCGWLKDKFGVSWQVVPNILSDMMENPDITKKEKLTKAYMNMKKYDISELKRAFEGQSVVSSSQ